jgi:hypothetical protein
MNAEELEAEGKRLVNQFEKDFEGVIRPFYTAMKIYAENVDKAPISDQMKVALLKITMQGLEQLGNIADRVAAEEGIA